VSSATSITVVICSSATRYQVGVAATSSAIALSTAASALTSTVWIAIAMKRALKADGSLVMPLEEEMLELAVELGEPVDGIRDQIRRAVLPGLQPPMVAPVQRVAFPKGGLYAGDADSLIGDLLDVDEATRQARFAAPFWSPTSPIQVGSVEGRHSDANGR